MTGPSSAAPETGTGDTGSSSETGHEVRPVYLVKGNDPSLVAQAVHGLVEELVGENDPSLVVEEFGGPGTDQTDVGAVIDACTTPAFLVDRRVVVVREAGKLGAADAKRLVDYLKGPLATTSLVVAAGGGALTASLSRAAGAAGRVIDTNVGAGRARSEWIAEHLRDGPVRLDSAAASLLSDHLGEDMGRLEGLLDTLATAYGPGSSVSVEDLEPFLGSAGTVAPWDLTDALDAGNAAQALSVLRRMIDSGESHPLAVLAILHRHYRHMLQLDGSAARTPEQAAELIGMRAVYPAKKAMTQGRRLGSTGIARALELIAAADLDVRGVTDLPSSAVLEVLVARLSRLGGAARR